MDFLDEIKQFSKRADTIKEKLTTEEATKTSLIMPFFKLLGYDIFNPTEFVPEFTADVGIKKGEKVDYAIIKDDKPVILIEAKSVNNDLTKHDAQLFRYFTVTDSKFAILTNGLVYKFFTDLEEPNKMDEKPFLEVDLLNINDTQIAELKKFTKEKFDIDTILNTASELKYSSLIKAQLNNQLNNPTDDFVRFIIGDFFTGIKTSNVVEKFRPIVKKSMQQFVNDFMNDKIKSILEDQKINEDKEEVIDTTVDTSTDIKDTPVEPKEEIIPTDEELEAFNIIQGMLSELVNKDDITHKAVKSYVGILYKNNVRKWVCRLFFYSTKKYLGFPDKDKNDTIYYEIENLNDIYKYKNEFLDSLKKFL